LRAAGAAPPPPAKLGLEKYKSGMHSELIMWDILAGLRFFLAWIVACSHLQHFVPNDTDLSCIQCD
jgi:hypothetical protein